MSDRGDPTDPPRPSAVTFDRAWSLASLPLGTRRSVPGFRAYLPPPSASRSVKASPRCTYRDSSHSPFGHTPALVCTGISGTGGPGRRAHQYREVEHTTTGNPGTIQSAATGIPGTNGPANSPAALGNPASNFVLSNRSKNTTTRGARFLNRVEEQHRGPWPTTS